MPPVSATLIELLTYLAPGFVVLYGIRRQADSLQKLFETIATPHGGSALIALSLTAMAFGLMIAAMAQLLVPWLSRLTTRDKGRPMHVRQLDFSRLYTRPSETLQMLQHHMRVYNAYANMATALLISLGILFYNLWDAKPVDHWQFKIVFHSTFTLLTFWAAIRYFRVAYHIAHALSQP